MLPESQLKMCVCVCHKLYNYIVLIFSSYYWSDSNILLQTVM